MARVVVAGGVCLDRFLRADRLQHPLPKFRYFEVAKPARSGSARLSAGAGEGACLSTSKHKIGVGVIGCGHWGPNHVRVFAELDRSHVVSCSDLNAGRLERLRSRFPAIETMPDHRSILDNPRVDAVVIATPTSTHAALVREALDAGKHVLVEKPLCLTSAEAVGLRDWARECGRVLMVGHVFLFNNGIMKLHDLMAADALGRIHYLDAVRTNLGPVRGDVNALFDLGSHDLSIFNYLLDSRPDAVSATGSCISQDRNEDVCFATFHYPGGALAHLHVSWLNPRKVRTLTAVGESKMAHWDDIDPADTLRIYDKGFQEPPYYDSFGEFQYLLRSGDVHVPTVNRCEPLVNQANAFLDSILDGRPCRSGAEEAAAVIAALEAATTSIRNNGQRCDMNDADVDVEPAVRTRPVRTPPRSPVPTREPIRA